ncbi:carbonic anhydrase-like isoform X3 [Dermacentor variabilis]|uniref:carbonic anhydrase-like isoform X3 n=1 Tax=Dermacentor variabilis TaxID=34621 RepID=UPI003F5C5BCE
MLAAPTPLLVLAVLIAVADRGSCHAKWGYTGEFAPHNWVSVDTSPNVNQCGDKLQSPVDLDDRYAEYDPGLTDITFSGYDQELYNPYIVNNGHTVQVSATEDSNRYIEGARLPGRFQFAQFHLHWGANSSRGSEHTIRGFQYPLELHFVHFNVKYGSAAESMKYEDGLAVIAVYFEVSPTANEDMSVVVDALKEVRLSDEKGFNLQRPVVLSRFLPRITRSYFRYQGSLTTPPCSQAVTFTVMTTTVPISEEQLQQFRLLRTGKDENSSTMVDNFRPTFPLNGRRVFKSFPSSATRPGLGPEGFPSLQDADDSYAIFSESGFDERFRDLASVDSLAQGVGEVVRRCNYVRSFADWPRHSRACAPVWNAFGDPLGLTASQPLVLAQPFYDNPATGYYQLVAYGKKKKK